MITVTNLITKTGPQGTFGLVQTPMRIHRSGQLPWKNNASDISCIPEGTYTGKWTITDKHPNGVYMLMDVPGRVACEIHIGNYCGDTSLGYRSDVDGCTILGLGETDATIINTLTHYNEEQHIVDESTLAIEAFNAEMAGEDIQWVVKCQDGVGPFVVMP